MTEELMHPANLPPAYLHLGGFLDAACVSRTVTALEQLRGRVREVVFVLHGGGGERMPADALHCLIAGWPVPTVGFAVGQIASAMLSVLLGTATRYATPTASFAFHGTAWTPPANSHGRHIGRGYLEQILVKLRAHDEAQLAQLLSRGAFDDPTEAEALVGDLTTRTLPWCQSRGIIHGVRPLAIPADAILVSVEPSAEPTPAAPPRIPAGAL